MGMAFHVPKEANAYQSPDEQTASTTVSPMSRNNVHKPPAGRHNHWDKTVQEVFCGHLLSESKRYCTMYLQVLYNELVQYTDTGAAVGDPVATFDGAAVLAPRGRFNIELYLSFLKLTGQVWISIPSASANPHAWCTCG